MNDLTLTVTQTINAPVETVFKAWLDPKLLARFMFPGEGVRVPEVQVDPSEGGRFRIVMQAGEKQMPHCGTYRKITPHSQLIFTWESEFSPGESTVTVNLSPVEGGTHVELVQVKFLDEGTRNQHQGGWTRILAQLDSVLS